MRRAASEFLDTWLASRGRRPLVVRGARQVGKTWLVRDLARRHRLDLLEVNFERDPQARQAFEGGHPRETLGDLGIRRGRPLDPARGLLFLDEVLAAGDVLASLRYFAEELPTLPVVAAGSLLDLTLGDHAFSMPVGRVGYLHLQPLCWREYLWSHGQEALDEALSAWTPGEPLRGAVHEAASRWFARFRMVGGMPAVVAAEADGEEPAGVRRLQHDLLATFLDDFGKYARQVDHHLLDATLRSVARQLGGKFVYARVSEGTRSAAVKRALDLLVKARLCHVVEHSAANGVPLAGEVKPRNRKVLLLDVGLTHALLQTPATQSFPRWGTFAPAVRGAITEQVVGQALLGLAAPWESPRLFYWQRGGGRPGEIDFLVQVGTAILPVEVKAGSAGTLKSLHQFMHDKGLGVALRCDANPPSRQALDVGTTQGQRARYELLSLPPYLLHRLPDLFDQRVA